MNNLTKNNPTRPLSGMSDREVLDWWVSANLSSMRPEECEEVAPVTLTPPDDVIPFIIAEAKVLPDWADSSQIQCNVCGRRSQFQSGGYYAHYGDGYIYVVGPVCGSDEHQASVTMANNAFIERQRRELADERVKDFLDNPDEWGRRITEVKAYEQTCIHLFMCFNLDFPDSDKLRYDLQASIKEDGGTLRHYPESRTGFPTNIHRLQCVDIFNQVRQSSAIEEITSIIAKEYGFSFKGGKKELVFSEENVEKLSRLLGDLNRVLNEREKWIERARKHVIRDIKGLLLWQERAENSQLVFEGLRISIEKTESWHYDTERTTAVCDFSSLESSFETVVED